MKTIVILGSGSYIGGRLAKWLARWPEAYRVRPLSLRQPGWQDMLAHGDAVIQLAGVAHRRAGEQGAADYYKVNRDMAYQAAKAAKAAGARQFIYMSSMSVYGRVTGHIDGDTPLAPNTHYGKSKLAAEALIAPLAGPGYQVAILRPPLVFGPGCKGNYPRLSRLAQRTPLFPRFEGARSMVYVDHLCEGLRLIVDAGAGGLFFPVDRQDYNVPQMMQMIARAHGKRLRLVPGCNWLVKRLAKAGALGKVLGSLTYDRSLPGAPGDYQLYTNEEALRLTETEGPA